MNKNTILGLVLIFVILIGYSWWMSPSKEEIAEKKRIEDSNAVARQKYNDSLKAITQSVDTSGVKEETVTVVTDTSSTMKAELIDRMGWFAGAAVGEDKLYILESDKLKLGISAKGGYIATVELKDYKTFDSLPLVLTTPEFSSFGFTFFSNNRSINTEQLYFEPFWYDNKQEGEDVISIQGNDSAMFAMRVYPSLNGSAKDLSRYIEFRYTIRGGKYLMGFDVNFIGMQDIIAPNTTYINFDWFAQLYQQEKSLKNEKIASAVFYKFYQDDVDNLSETKDDEENLQTKVKWVSFKQQFFCQALIANESFSSVQVKSYADNENERYIKTMEARIDAPYVASADYSIPMSLYYGPNHFQTLRKYKLELERQIPLGWSFFLLAWINKFAVIPVFNFLGGFDLSYGIIILILTILLKIVLFPIAYKTYTSQARMKVLKPEIEEINKKFSKQDEAVKKQQAVMALYKQAGVNPMSGCIPMLLQLPILIALFRFFPASIELRQESFLWAQDLSTYDSILDLPFNIPFYGDHVSLFTLLMTVSTILYTMINNQMMSSSQQIPGMKLMMYLMPVMFLGFFNSYASALSYYYFLANMITFGQMYLIRRLIDEEAIHKKIREKQKKPVKKSKFQKRLEEMAKQRTAMAAKGKKR